MQISVNEASSNLSALMGQTAHSHQPIVITDHARNAVPPQCDDVFFEKNLHSQISSASIAIN